MLAKAGASIDLDEADGRVGAGHGRDADGRPVGFFLAEDDPRAVGKALHWAGSKALAHVTILAEGWAGDLARRSELMSDPGASGVVDGPSIAVLAVVGSTIEPAVATPPVEPPPVPDEQWALAGIITETGARAIDDHGRLVAEVAGLEIGRVVDGPGDGLGPTIDVGVGQADRELTQLVHRDAQPGDGLRRVMATVAEHRRAGSHHPLTRVGRERWIRSMLLDDPALVGAAELEPIVPLRPRAGLNVTEPAPAAGTRIDGGPIVVVTMVGIDLDLVPEAADYRHRHDPEAEVVIVVPERDARLNGALLDRLADARLVTLRPPWL